MTERQLRIDGVRENVAQACEFVVAQAREAGLDERSLHHCYLAVDEACTNIIEHGYEMRCFNCIIDVICQYDAEALTITIIDDSPQFDPLARPNPDPKMTLSERNEGGWGIFFIKKLMDSVSYTYKDRRNYFVMVKKIDRGSAAQGFPPRDLPAIKPIEARPFSDKVWQISLSGRLDDSQTSRLSSVLAAQLEAGHPWLIVNMADVDYISSGGLKTLVSAWQRIRDQKGDLVLTALKPRVREVLQMIGLDLVFTISETPDQARAYFATKVK